MSCIILKKGREKSLLQRHPWIFSGAIESAPECEKGTLLPIHDHSGQFLAQSYYNASQSLAARVLSFDQEPIQKSLQKKVVAAHKLREMLFQGQNTNTYRLINGEGDGLPGLIVDRYDTLYVMQISTWGMLRLKDQIVEALVTAVKPRSIYLKLSATDPEDLKLKAGTLFGDKIHQTQVLENGITFHVDCEKGQKTGLFLDQRRMRELVGSYSKNRRVLNGFSYTGGFSLYALQAAAQKVTSVDVSQWATEQCRHNVALNGFSNHTAIEKDFFAFLKQATTIDAELIILDPPAFAKKREDIPAACSAYKELNRLVFEKAEPGTVLLSASCSYQIDAKLFQTLLFQAAADAGREVQILARHRQAEDHPISIFHPEGDYLKSLLLLII